MVEGNHYFPPDSVRMEFLQPVDHTTVCGWKGVANYYDIVVDGKRNPGAAWYYAAPLPAASRDPGAHRVLEGRASRVIQAVASG